MASFQGHGGGGGRQFPGTGGTRGTNDIDNQNKVRGGTGGSANNTGGHATIPNHTDTSMSGGGGGGGWGANGGWAVYTQSTNGPYTDSSGVGLGGKAIDLNGYTVSWTFASGRDLSNSVYGAVS